MRCGCPSLGAVVATLVALYAVVVGGQVALLLWPGAAFLDLQPGAAGGGAWYTRGWPSDAPFALRLEAVGGGRERPQLLWEGRSEGGLARPFNVSTRLAVPPAARAPAGRPLRLRAVFLGPDGRRVAVAVPLVRAYVPARPGAARREVPHVLRRVRLHLVDDGTAWPSRRAPADVLASLRYHAGAGGGTYPAWPLASDRVWARREDHDELDAAAGEGKEVEVDLRVEYTPASLAWFRFTNQMGGSFEMLSRGAGLGAAEVDEMRALFLDTQPALLATTVAVAVLHTAFDVLALRSDINFWRRRKDFTGLSARALLLSLGSRLVVLLYLVDNDTSRLVLMSCVFGLAVTAWKLARVSRLRVRRWCPPSAGFDAPLEGEERSRRHDADAARHATLALPVALLASLAYSVAYRPVGERGLYSWLVASLAGAVYVFGFALMWPQLYLNYRLKSVAHLPWSALVYRALNTFVDDFFAFVMPMPDMHRLAVFRDDIVFLVYLYQRWIYPSDPSRGPDSVGEAEEGAPGPAPTEAEEAALARADAKKVN